MGATLRSFILRKIIITIIGCRLDKCKVLLAIGKSTSYLNTVQEAPQNLSPATTQFCADRWASEWSLRSGCDFLQKHPRATPDVVACFAKKAPSQNPSLQGLRVTNLARASGTLNT